MAQTFVDDRDQFGVPGIGRAFVVGALIGFVLTLGVTGGITLLAGAGLGPAIAVGVYAGLWGGPGFGGMLGAVGCLTRSGH